MANTLALAHGASVDRVFRHALKGFVVRMPEASAIALAADPRVRYVEEDGTVSLDGSQSPATWGLDRLDQRDLPLDDTYRYGPTGSGVNAYIIDTGIRVTHSEFGGRAYPGFDAMGDGKGTNDCHGHGTHVAGTVGGATWGVAKDVKLYAVRVLNCSGYGTYSSVIAGVDWVTANHVKPAVANMSLGGGAAQALDDAVEGSVAAGVTYAIAAGNSSWDACDYSPARAPSAITVGATANDDARAGFSNWGTCVDIFAPGVDVTSAWIENDTASLTASGTSMAAPHVAGAAALFLELNPTATPATVTDALLSNASVDKVTNPGTGSPNRLLYSGCGTSEDTQSPQVVLTGPTEGATLTGTVTLTANATDDVGVLRVEFFVDGRSVGSDSTAPYELTWNSATASNGAATLVARAYDAGCNAGTSAVVGVTLSNVGNASWNANTATPACLAFGNKCDTVTLVSGRGSAGPERNQPNTLGGACADGASGGYRASPSIERIRVERADGTDFAAGKEVLVQVSVWATADYASERLDLFITSDVNDPSWQYVTTLSPSGSGNQVLSTPMILPQGGVQALRASYRSGGTAGTCTTGASDDHDDLVFAVDQQPDTVPPTVAFTQPTGGATVQGDVSVVISASDNFGVSRVELYDGPTLVGTDAFAPHVITWNTRTGPNGSHELTARAYDAAGHVSAASITVTVDNDYTPPAVSVDAPQEGQTVSGTVTVSASASDDRGVSRVEFHVDGNVIATDSTPPFSRSWNSRTVANGGHTVTAKAYDTAGNTSTASVTVTVDNDLIPPTTAVTSPEAGAVLSGAVTFEATASDDRGVTRVELYAGAKRVATLTAAPYSMSWDTTTAGNGDITLTSKAYDAAGNVTTSAPVTVRVRNQGRAGFDPVLKAPVCDTLYSSCDSGPLVIGRAQLGPEPNHPNTIHGSCADGTFGGFHWSESVDRLRVIRLDGTNLAAGKRVRVEVDVWSWSFFSDFVDIYYATDATNPTWVLLTTLKASGNDAETLSTEYILPAGPLQAIRASMRDQGDPSPCTDGPYDDRDDLVFVVGNEADDAPPTVAITAPAEGSTVAGSVNLGVNAQDNFGVTKVELYVDGVLVGTDTSAPYGVTWSSRSVANGSHTLVAKAYDFAGNVGTSAAVTVTVDNEANPPTVAITSPQNGATVRSYVNVTFNASDDRSVTRVELYVDGALVGSDNTAPYSVQWHSRSLPNGSHTLVAKAYDTSENVGTSTPITVTTDNDFTPPTVVVSAPANGATVRGIVEILVDATDDVGMESVSFYVDGYWVGNDTTAPFSFQWNSRDSANGTHTVQAWAYDKSYNSARSTTVSFTLDNESVPPQVVLTSPTEGATVGGSAVVLGANASDDSAIAKVEFLLNGTELIGSDTTAPYEVSWDATTALEGSSTITARALDTSANVTLSAPVTVTIDNPGVAQYDSTLKAPRCDTVTNRCDTDRLVRGRAQLGPEPNQPNTIHGSCADGTAGTYKSAESIERIRITRLDGSNLAAGKKVRVDVEAWIYSSWSNLLDLYYAADATSPSWKYIGTLTPTRSGAETLSTEYVLPAGSLQALRARLRYGSWGPSPCGSSSWDDHDDVVFAVGQEPDFIPPTVALTAPADGAKLGGVVPLAATADDDFGVARVEFYDGTTLIGTDTSAPFAMNWNTSGAPDGSRSLTAKAYDLAGNSATSRVNVVVDNLGPSVAITSPASGAAVRGAVTIHATANDAVGVAKVELYVGNTLIGTQTTAPYAQTWDTSTVANGSYVLSAKAYDTSGRVATSTGVSITVDNIKPVTAITSPQSGAAIRGVFTVDIEASDDFTVTKVELYAGDALVGSLTSAPYSVSWDTRSVANGQYTLTSKAYDAAGNVTTSAGVQVTVDNTAPSVAITSPKNSAVVSGTVTISATASDNTSVAKVEFYDGNVLIGTDTSAPYSVGWNTSSATKGPHNLTARAYDAAGNRTTSAVVTVTVL